MPTVSPSATPSPTDTEIEPRCVSVTDQPSGVRSETVFPLDGSDPAKVTTPSSAERTAEPSTPAMSIPRWPDAV